MSTTRVKESCLPCRRRKTRCDDAQPCSSCVLRKTQADCRPAGSAHALELAQLDARDAEYRKRGPSVAAPGSWDGDATIKQLAGGSRAPTGGAWLDPSLPRRAGGDDAGKDVESSVKRRRMSSDRSLDRAPRGYAPTSDGPRDGLGLGNANGTGPSRFSESGVTMIQTAQALDELARLRASVAVLERHCLEMDAAAKAAAKEVAKEKVWQQTAPSGSSASPAAGEAVPVSPEDRQRWETLWAALPDLGSCEILLEYLVQECDFLYPSGDVVNLWLSSARSRGLSQVHAGKLALAFATSALLLGHGSHPFYRPKCNPVALNVALWDLAQAYAVLPPTNLAEVEVAVDFGRYLVYSGRNEPIPCRGPGTSIQTALDIGLLDEGHPSWYGLSEPNREYRRQVATDLVLNARWASLMLPKDPLLQARFNVCLPAFTQTPLDTPIRTLRDTDISCMQAFADQEEPDFRLFRVKSKAERQRTQTFRLIMMRISEALHRIKELHRQMQQVDPADNAQVDNLAIRAASINEELRDWYERKLPQAGWPIPTADDVSPTDMARCKRASQSLSLHNAITFLQAAVLRPWLTAGIHGQRHDSVRKSLHDDCLRNADRIMQSLPVIKALLATRTQPIITPWSACVCFIAAMSYAVPLLRAVQKLMFEPASAAEEDIRRLPALSDVQTEWRAATEGLPSDGGPHEEEKPIPAFLFSDNEVRTCANNILKALDVLSILRVSPLGASAEAKVRNLIKKYNLATPEHSPAQMEDGAMVYELPGPAAQPLMPPIAGQAGADGLSGLTADFACGPPDMRHENSVDQGASALLQLAGNGNAVFYDAPSSGQGQAVGGPSSREDTANSVRQPLNDAASQPPPADLPHPNPFALDFDTLFPATMDSSDAYFGLQPGLAAGTTANPVVLEQLFQMDSRLWENWLDPLPTPAIPPPQL